MENISVKRLYILEDNIIKTNLADINLDDTYDKYDLILDKVFNGEADDIFLSAYLDDVSEDDKKEIFKLARKYQDLCFYQGIYDNWLDSPYGVTALQPDTVSQLLLNDYDFIIRLAKHKDESILEFLRKLNNTKMSKESSIIAGLRSGFYRQDDILEEVIIEMSNENGKYKNFSQEQKLLLLEEPQDILYRKNDKELELIPVEELENNLRTSYDSNYSIKEILETIDIKTFEELLDIVNGNLQNTYKK